MSLMNQILCTVLQRKYPFGVLLVCVWLYPLSFSLQAAANTEVAAPNKTAAPSVNSTTGEAPSLPSFYVREYRVIGAKQLSPLEVETAVYPFMGPERTTDDVEHARAALEKAFKDKGYQTVSVEVPQQTGKHGIIFLRVTEAVVGRLRVKGSRYFLLSDIKKRAPSMVEGKVPNFNDVQKDIVALNKSGDLRVTPELRAGVEPGTVDIDLNVKDVFPLHGSLELNNRYSADTKPLRVNGSLSYSNLWQSGHNVGFSFQVAPERTIDAKVYSAFYSLPVPGWDNVTFMLQGTKQDSNVSTLGGAAVAGRGQIMGFRTIVTLPTQKDFYHSLSFGMDYKHFDEDVTLGDQKYATPIDYYPLTANYNASWLGKGSFTEFNGAVNWHFRGAGSKSDKFDNKRYNADGSFFYFRGDLAHTEDLPGGFQVYGKVQGQASNTPLINSEQFAGGGLSTVRGYLESAALGDSGYFGTLELRSPSFIGKTDDKANEWRVYAFLEGGDLYVNDPLPDSTSSYRLASFGFGTHVRAFDHLNGSMDVGIPLITQGQTLAHDVFVTFRVWADF